jgi:hypothetical protein
MFEVTERPSILQRMFQFMLLEKAVSFSAMFLAVLLMPLESFGKEPHEHFGGAFTALLVAFGFGRSISRSSPRLAEMNCWAWVFPGSILMLAMLGEWLRPPPTSSLPSEIFYSSSATEGGIGVFLFTFPGVVSIGYSLGSLWARRSAGQRLSNAESQ